MKKLPKLSIALVTLMLLMQACWLQAQSRTNECETVLVFGTGTTAAGNLLRPGSADPSFEGISANFPFRPDAVVPTNIPAAWQPNSASSDSQWIAPLLDPADAAAGTYTYRLRFTTPCAGAVVAGRYAAGDRGVLRLNGAAISFPTPATGWTTWTAFSFNNLPAGNNTLEYYVTNTQPVVGGPPGPSGLRAELTVTATCCPCIELTCPPDLFLKTCSNGAPANFTITGTNRCYTNLTIACSLAAGTGIPVTSGTVLPVGTNIVICTATDTVGHRTNCSFRVIVARDNLPPEIRCPRDIVYLCGVAGTNVFYNVPATDDTDPNPVVVCTPPSGSFFPAGSTTVTCEARDACGHVSKCSFKVVIAPQGFTKTLQAGVADNFLPGGFEAPSSGPCLGGSGFWSGMPFDTSWPGRHLTHSFQGLPNNIATAKLILHMKPTQPASLDDVLRIGLVNCGGAGMWTFAQPVASLPGASGIWNINPPTTFTLDLAALPGGVNLLANLNADHRLEFAVGTETMVDYARLELTYCGPTTTLSGVPYSMQNVYPIHQGNGGVSWRTVNSNDPPILDIDAGQAGGLQFDFDFDFGLPQFCPSGGSSIGKHHGLSTDWPTGEGTIATLAMVASPIPGLTRITMSQPSNVIGKAIEVWNAGQLVTRYFLAGSGDTAVNVPSNACLFTMGFSTAYFFANFIDPVSVQILTGQHVSGQAGGIATGDSVRLYYVIKVSAPTPKYVRVTLPPGGFDVSGISLLHHDDWIKGFGPQQLTLSDVAISKALIDSLLHPYGDCSPAYGPWTLDLNGVAGFCTWDGGFNLPVCNNGYVDVNITGPGNAGTVLNFGGLRLTPTALPFDDCHIECTVAAGTATPYSLTINRMVGGPITLNNVSAADFSSWPLAVTGNAGPQSFGVTLAANTLVTVGAQTYSANGATFHASPTILTEFYQVCLETTFQSQMSFKSYHTTGINFPPDCLTLNCPTGAVANCTGGAGTVVTFNPTAATRCGSNVVVTCSPPSGSLFPPGVTYVHCVATDSQGDHDECRFPVTVTDVTPPQLVAPPRIIAPCTSPRGAVVEFAASALDACDPAVVVECRPPSGSVFPVGTNYVTCTAVDAGGNRSSTEFPVIVVGGCSIGNCVEITVPADLEVRCGAAVNFAATARNSCTGGSLSVTCAPPSGSSFPVGLTRVVCSAKSGADEASASFLVEVIDDTPPEITCSRNILAEAQSERGAVVSFTATGRDDCAPNVRVRCTPPSGSVFPVGQTQVLCEGTDGNGNVGQCSFIVTVEKPAPLQVIQLRADLLELRWTGDAVVEFTDLLSDEALWRTLAGTPESNGVERVLRIIPSGGQRFFRLRLLDLLPLPDTDGDGVPDIRDRCPGTPTGIPVDQYGCALFDLITTPERIFDPERATGRQTLRMLQLDGGFTDLVTRLSPALVNSNSPSVPLRERLLPAALNVESNFVQLVRGVLNDFLAQKGRRIAEIERSVLPLDAEHADVRPQDWELMRLEEIEQSLLDVLSQSETSLSNLAVVVAADGNRRRERVTLLSFDLDRGMAVLSDGRRLLLARPTSPGSPPLNQITDVFDSGSQLDVEISQLPDGTLVASNSDTTVDPSANAVPELDPRRLSLRVVPADPSLPDWDTGVRHSLKAYKWGFSDNTGYHFLEFGMAFAAVRTHINNPDLSHKHWLKVVYDHDGDGGYMELFSSMNENTKPFVLKTTQFIANRLTPMVIREYRALINPDLTLGTPELLYEQHEIIELYDRGYFAEADYSRTLFELEDRPDETGFQAAQVVDLIRSFPLTLQLLNQQTFSALSFTVNGNSSSYPSVNPVYLNTSFAVHRQDPNDQLFFSHPDDVGRGLYGPNVKGYNHNKPFQYRVRLPKIVRDRLHSCSGTDTYYRIPFPGGWEVSQGNNGTFTHNGNQKYAFDFPEDSGAIVLAARGGIVTKAKESSSQSCWNGSACVNCTGSASGNVIKILHQDGTEGVYVHFRQNGVLVSEGQRVYRGDIIGKVGTTGCSTGPHLHFHVVEETGSGVTIPVKFETYDDDDVLRNCYVPPHNSDGISTNLPWDFPWPF